MAWACIAKAFMLVSGYSGAVRPAVFPALALLHRTFQLSPLLGVDQEHCCFTWEHGECKRASQPRIVGCPSLGCPRSAGQ